MTDLRTTAQQALEALGSSLYPQPRQVAAIAALRAALAEPVQEPVAWMVYTEGGTSAYVTDNPNDLVGAYRALPLYAAPPQRKPLTEEEIKALIDSVDGLGIGRHVMHKVARAIERAHGIGEKE